MADLADAGLIKGLMDRARERGVHAVLRFEDRKSRGVAIEGERVESVEASFSTGLGVQVFTTGGHNGFSAVDDPDEERAAIALDRAIAAALAAEAAGLEANPAILGTPPSHGRADPPLTYPFEHLTVGEMRDTVEEFAKRVRGVANGVQVRTAFGLVRERWHILRSDGTDVAFVIPRSHIAAILTARKNGEAVRTSASAAGLSYEQLLDRDKAEALLSRAARAAVLAGDLLDAPSFPPGAYPLLIDFALAKGLAHEAFGHAAESDGLDSSILGDEGRFRAGQTFGGSNVTIIDEPIEGDNAYQPYSGNGVPRERTVILDRGVLREALADIHTAGRAGTPLRGSGRLASFANVPIPRMSNIRIEVTDPYPLAPEKDFYSWTPEEVRDFLVEAGDLVPGGRIVFLSGYRGGQVNPALGDFVFNSTAIYELTTEAVRLYKPGIFSGRIEAALHSIRRGYGPLRLDAAGTCGKAGQGVPSSGGSHHFLLMEQNEQVRIGGRS